MRGRIYDRAQYRFLTPDPVIADPLFGQAYNPYSYVYNNPLNLTDPSGYEPAEAPVEEVADGGAAYVRAEKVASDTIQVNVWVTVDQGAQTACGPAATCVEGKENGPEGTKSDGEGGNAKEAEEHAKEAQRDQDWTPDWTNDGASGGPPTCADGCADYDGPGLHPSALFLALPVAIVAGAAVAGGALGGGAVAGAAAGGGSLGGGAMGLGAFGLLDLAILSTWEGDSADSNNAALVPTRAVIGGFSLAANGLKTLAPKIPGGRFFWNDRAWSTVSRKMWQARGGARGNSLDHWLFPREAAWVPRGLRNAGFNIVIWPRSTRLTNGYFGGDINRFMGMAAKWGPNNANTLRAQCLRGVTTGGVPAIAITSFGGGYGVTMHILGEPDE